jgi:hypothetical protein
MQITAVLDGKAVIAPPREVQEVRNAIKAYEKLNIELRMSGCSSLHANQSNKSNINPLTHSAEGAI